MQAILDALREENARLTKDLREARDKYADAESGWWSKQHEAVSIAQHRIEELSSVLERIIRDPVKAIELAEAALKKGALT